MRVFVGLLLIIIGVTLIFAGASSSGLNLLSAVLGNSGTKPKVLSGTDSASQQAQSAIDQWLQGGPYLGGTPGAVPGTSTGDGGINKPGGKVSYPPPLQPGKTGIAS